MSPDVGRASQRHWYFDNNAPLPQILRLFARESGQEISALIAPALEAGQPWERDWLSSNSIQFIGFVQESALL